MLQIKGTQQGKRSTTSECHDTRVSAEGYWNNAYCSSLRRRPKWANKFAYVTLAPSVIYNRGRYLFESACFCDVQYGEEVILCESPKQEKISKDLRATTLGKTTKEYFVLLQYLVAFHQEEKFRPKSVRSLRGMQNQFMWSKTQVCTKTTRLIRRKMNQYAKQVFYPAWYLIG